MPQSFMVECPNCHARGELSDPSLMGKAISCPACQVVFTLPAPAAPVQPMPIAIPMNVVQSGSVAPATPAATAIPSEQYAPSVPQVAAAPGYPVQVIQQPVPVPAMPPVEVPSASVSVANPWPVASPPNSSFSSTAPLPQVSVGSPVVDYSASDSPIDPASLNFGATGLPVGLRGMPSLSSGIAEEQFAQSLPQPAGRGSVPARKPMSKQTTILIGSGISAVVLFAIIMFLSGDSFRNAAKARDERVTAEKEREKEKKAMKAARRTSTDNSAAEMYSKIQAMNAGGSDAAPSTTTQKSK